MAEMSVVECSIGYSGFPPSPVTRRYYGSIGRKLPVRYEAGGGREQTFACRLSPTCSVQELYSTPRGCYVLSLRWRLMGVDVPRPEP